MPNATPKGIARAFHNALFTDFQTSKAWGTAKDKERIFDMEYVTKIVPEMGLDKPYFDKKADPNNFCHLNKKRRLAVVGMCVKPGS